eukprot:TRINITY_DN127368_c0_g1_i1.p1 TRINITY_DN127368_c0_g1~~TRINITY_DN127368_c0_g1_i1.p1  ORF type:complete len:813 (+),score=230.29 TRINITY_DN127368_c0_g1_i1:73-2511(+)
MDDLFTETPSKACEALCTSIEEGIFQGGNTSFPWTRGDFYQSLPTLLDVIFGEKRHKQRSWFEQQSKPLQRALITLFGLKAPSKSLFSSIQDAVRHSGLEYSLSTSTLPTTTQRNLKDILDVLLRPMMQQSKLPKEIFVSIREFYMIYFIRFPVSDVRQLRAASLARQKKVTQSKTQDSFSFAKLNFQSIFGATRQNLVSIQTMTGSSPYLQLFWQYLQHFLKYDANDLAPTYPTLSAVPSAESLQSVAIGGNNKPDTGAPQQPASLPPLTNESDRLQSLSLFIKLIQSFWLQQNILITKQFSFEEYQQRTSQASAQFTMSSVGGASSVKNGMSMMGEMGRNTSSFGRSAYGPYGENEHKKNQLGLQFGECENEDVGEFSVSGSFICPTPDVISSLVLLITHLQLDPQIRHGSLRRYLGGTSPALAAFTPSLLSFFRSAITQCPVAGDHSHTDLQSILQLLISFLEPWKAAQRSGKPSKNTKATDWENYIIQHYVFYAYLPLLAFRRLSHVDLSDSAPAFTLLTRLQQLMTILQDVRPILHACDRTVSHELVNLIHTQPSSHHSGYPLGGSMSHGPSISSLEALNHSNLSDRGLLMQHQFVLLDLDPVIISLGSEKAQVEAQKLLDKMFQAEMSHRHRGITSSSPSKAANRGQHILKLLNVRVKKFFGLEDYIPDDQWSSGGSAGGYKDMASQGSIQGTYDMREGSRSCEADSIDLIGDTMMRPVNDFELSILVGLFVRASCALNLRLGLWSEEEYANVKLAADSREPFQRRIRASRRLVRNPLRINLRFFADVRNLFFTLVILFIFWLFFM